MTVFIIITVFVILILIIKFGTNNNKLMKQAYRSKEWDNYFHDFLSKRIEEDDYEEE